MNIKFSAKTDVGRKRRLNEDSFCVAEDIGLFLVADGMGGHAGGEIASQTTVEVVKMSLINWLKKGPPNSEIFARAIQLANKAVFEMAEKGHGMKGMGTTIAGILVCNGSFVSANVGDSRVYRIRNNRIEQLSQDHSVVGMQLAMGLITEEAAKKSAYKNVITRAVGTKGVVEVDTRDEEIVRGDLILICSDGLTSLVENNDILDIIVRDGNNLDNTCEELIGLANFNGGDDNITVVLVKFS
ncbi:MAG: Stp1/IreP family PP2C-type Ser/Thr phosphatase [Deltaproteobacteria bacterium]|nr:Stp1/IreP family PP2C-type Ser/Thr phosphatase [Deltaproteobacteria bacterium]